MKTLCVALLFLVQFSGARAQAAGVACGASNACNTGLVCDTDAKCKNKVGATCTPGGSANCPVNAACSGTSGAETCTCSGNFQTDSDLCKAKAGQTCNAVVTPAIACVTGYTCSSTTAAGTCLANAGQMCNAVATPAIACVTGYTCSSTTTAGTCQAQAGKACNAVATPPVSCITGLTCSSTTTAGTCSGAASVIASLTLLLTSIVTSRFV